MALTGPGQGIGSIATGIGSGTSGALSNPNAPLATGLANPGITSSNIVGGQPIASSFTDPTAAASSLSPQQGQAWESNEQFAAINSALQNTGNFANQQLANYEKGILPPGQQAAIDAAARSGLGATSAELAQEGIDPASSSQFAGAAENIAIQKSTATQQALEQVLQNYFTAQGMQMQATEILGQFNQFDQELQLQYAQLALQAQEFQQQQKSAEKGQIGSLASSAGGLMGAGKMILATSMTAIYEMVQWASQ